MKEQLKISAVLKYPAGDFAFFRRGTEIHLFEGIRPLDMSKSMNQDETRWIHAPQFFHLRYEFLTFDSHQVITTAPEIEKNESKTLDFGAWKEPSFSAYETQFKHIENLLHLRSIRKAVPVVFEKSERAPERHEIFQMIQNLLHAENVFCYGLVQGGEGVLGATPEYLFSISGRELESLAVAGTQWEESENSSSEWSNPLQREHVAVIEDIERKLQPLGKMRREETQEVKVGFLRHLKTQLRCDLNQSFSKIKDIYFLIKKLHPTAALGVLSDEIHWKEMEFWPGQEEPRGSFGAPLTFRWSSQDVLSLVSIRQIAWNSKGSRIGSGGGLVLGSELGREWQELQKKRKYVKTILGIK